MNGDYFRGMSRKDYLSRKYDKAEKKKDANYLRGIASFAREFD